MSNMCYKNCYQISNCYGNPEDIKVVSDAIREIPVEIMDYFGENVTGEGKEILG